MNSPHKLRNISLIGFMGTGKTSVGHQLAGALNFTFVDTDELIERRAGAKISDIFALSGEAAFRAHERAVVEGLQVLDRTVISTGGGLAAIQENLDTLKEHTLVVCLCASADAIWERVRHQAHRPLLQTPDPLATIRDLLAKREPFYRQADLLINTELRSVREVVIQVLLHFRDAAHGATA